MGDKSHVTVRVNGRGLRARRDLPLLNALVQGSVPLLGRSLKYHRPRGPSCGTGQCTGCLVRVNGEPSVRSCQRFPLEGDVVTTERGWPSTRHDLLRIFDRIFPHHMDTLHGFTRPALLRPLYQRFIRPFSGFGALPEDPGPRYPPPRSGETEYLVVGGGRAAQVAYAELERLVGRARVLKIGHPKRPQPQDSLVHLPPPVEGWFTALAYREGGSVLSVRARTVLLCTGAYDASLLFEGNDLPGVMTGEGAEALVRGEGASPFERALLFGGGTRAEEMLNLLQGRVGALASPGAVAPSLATAAERAGVPVYPSHMILSARGGTKVRRSVLMDRESQARVNLPVDAIVTVHRRLPHGTALFQAGAAMHWDNHREAYFPDVSASGETTVPHLYVAGEVAGSRTESEISESAHRAAHAMAAEGMRRATIDPGPPLVPREDPRIAGVDGAEKGSGSLMLPYYREYLETGPRSKVVVCPCEDVGLDDLEEVLEEGWGGLETAKRMSAVGMGLCQGRYCLPETILILSIREGRPPAEIGFITQRPPIWPIPIGALAAESEESHA